MKSENFNASFIEQGIEQRDRLFKLNDIARSQLKAFLNNKNVRNLEEATLEWFEELGYKAIIITCFFSSSERKYCELVFMYTIPYILQSLNLKKLR